MQDLRLAAFPAVFARVFTASEIAAFRALRHKIVEPPDGGAQALENNSLQPKTERFHDEVDRP